MLRLTPLNPTVPRRRSGLLGGPLPLLLAAHALGACSRPDADVLFRPFREPSLHDGLPEAGIAPDAGGETPGELVDAAAPDARAPSPDADATADAGLGEEGAVRPDAAILYWGFDNEAEMNQFGFFDSEVVSVREWHDADEHAASGHFILTAPFDGPGQLVQVRVPIEGSQDFSGRSLKIRLRKLSGAGPGGAQGFAQSGGDWIWTSGPWHDFATLSTFTVMSLDFDSTMVPAEVWRYGMQVHSSNGGGADNTHALIVDAFWIE